MRSSVYLLAKHVPLIKFPNRRAPVKIDPTPKPHFFSNGVMPGDLPKSTNKAQLKSSSNKYGESKASIELRSELPSRFRYRPIDEIEIEDVNFGGAEVFLK